MFYGLKNAALFVLGLCVFSQNVLAEGPGNTAQTALHRSGDLVINQLVTPEFDNLPLNRRIFAYYISRAIDMGRDIAWHQNSRDGVAIRVLLEHMLRNSSRFGEAPKAALEDYAFRLFANHGPHDGTTHEKFVPQHLNWEQFEALAQTADRELRRQAAREQNLSEDDSKLKVYPLLREARRLRRAIFDVDYERYFHAPESLGDTILHSATNVYGRGLTRDQIVDQHGSQGSEFFLTYPMDMGDGTIRMMRNRIGERFDAQLRMIDYFLEQALPYANKEERAILNAHRLVMRTGRIEDQKALDRLWVQHKSPDLDFVLGFVETYVDPWDVRGSWEGFILLRNISEKATERATKLREHFFEFENDTPIDPIWRKGEGSEVPNAESAFLVYTGGDNGERPFKGVNLPNWEDVQAEFGSKSFSADNVIKELGGQMDPIKLAEKTTFFHPQYHDAIKAFDDSDAYDLQVMFHEILGHGMGKNHPGVEGTAHIGGIYSPLEEGRAEIASVYHLLGDVVRKIEITPEHKTLEGARHYGLMATLDFFTRHINQFYLLKDDTTHLTQPHQRGRQVMFNRLREDGALRVELSADGVPQLLIDDLSKVRASLGALLAEVQAAKSRDGEAAARAIFDRWGKYTDEHREWRHAIIAARDRLGLPKEKPVFLNPIFTVTRDEDGEITDVKLSYEQPSGFTVRRFIDRQVEMGERFSVALEECRKKLEPKND